MKIYTKTGDAGETGLFGGKRVKKDHLRIEVYGTLDELNATLGIALSGMEVGAKKGWFFDHLSRIQNELFCLGAELATPTDKKLALTPIAESEITLLETAIDVMQSELPELKNFILPRGTLFSSQIHFSRTVCRRAERLLVTLMEEEEIREITLQYVNRLSDFLFVLARYANLQSSEEEIPWKR